MTDNVSDLHVDVDLDLDVEEIDEKDRKKPFTTRIGGRVIVFKDPEDADWQDLLEVESPHQLLRLATDPDDREHIYNQKMTARKFGKLMKAYENHYGLNEKMQQARREAARNNF